MNSKLKEIIDAHFLDIEMNDEAQALHDELSADLNERFEDLLTEGVREEDAIEMIRADLADFDELTRRFPHRRTELAQVDPETISVEGIDAEQYRDFSGHPLDYEEITSNIAFFYDHKKQCEMNIKINGDILTPEQEETFYHTFGNMTDGISVEHTIDYWPKYHQHTYAFFSLAAMRREKVLNRLRYIKNCVLYAKSRYS